MHGPAEAVLKPALAAKDRRQADGRRQIAGRATLPQVREEEAGARTLTHCIQFAGRLPVADVPHGLSEVCGVSKLLEFDSGERGAVVAAAVEDGREVSMGKGCLTQLGEVKHTDGNVTVISIGCRMYDGNFART